MRRRKGGGGPLPVDAPFARAVLERIAVYRVEALAALPADSPELEHVRVDSAVLNRIVGALEAHLTDAEVRELEARALGFVYDDGDKHEARA